MRARTVFILLLICILLVAFGPALIAVVSQSDRRRRSAARSISTG